MNLFDTRRVPLIIFVSLIILYFIYLFIVSNKERDKIRRLNLQLKGVIIDKQEFKSGHDYGFVLIDIKSSNYKKFNQFKKTNNYLFIIDNKKCILVIPSITIVEKGDSIIVDKIGYSIIRNDRIFRSEDFFLPNRLFYDVPKWNLSSSR